MPTWMRPVLLIAGALALEACCNGPFVYVDCMASSITVRAVDASGEPVLVDEVRWSVDGGPTAIAECWGSDTGGATGCDEFYVPVSEDGAYTVELLLGGEVVGSDTIDAAIPKGAPGECCGSVFLDERDVEVDPVSTP